MSRRSSHSKEVELAQFTEGGLRIIPATDSPAAFFALTLLLSVPFYILNAFA